MGVSSLAQVLTGWTGSFVIDDGVNAAYTITPYTRDSAASLVVRVMHELLVRSGITATTEVDDLGVITMTLDAALTGWTTSGLVATRTGIASGSGSTIQGGGAFSGIVLPAYGMRLADPLVATTRGSSTTYGGEASSGARRSGRSTLHVYRNSIGGDSFENNDYDLWHDGRIQGRFRIDSVRRVPLSRTLRSDTTTRLECEVEEVV